MSLRLIQPGASAVLGLHPKTGEPIHPLGFTKHGKPIWPVMGGSSDDPDDPSFTGEDGKEDDDSEEDDDDFDDDDDPKDKKKITKKGKESSDDDEEDDKPTRPERQAARYRTQLRDEQRKNREMADRLKALEDKDKKPDEIVSRDLAEATARADKAEGEIKTLTAQLAFFRTGGVDWIDPGDAFALAEREGLFDDVIDDSGTVDARELRKGLRDLAKRKPHLVKATEDPKARGRKTADDDDEDDEEEPRSTRPMNGRRRGKGNTGPTRAELAKQFPVLNRH